MASLSCKYRPGCSPALNADVLTSQHSPLLLCFVKDCSCTSTMPGHGCLACTSWLSPWRNSAMMRAHSDMPTRSPEDTASSNLATTLCSKDPRKASTCATACSMLPCKGNKKPSTGNLAAPKTSYRPTKFMKAQHAVGRCAINTCQLI